MRRYLFIAEEFQIYCSSVYRPLDDEVNGKKFCHMFHSKTVNRLTEIVLETIRDENSSLRMLTATNLIRMGLNFNFNFVVHCGVPSEFDAYLQQIGRVGCDGSQSHAVLLYMVNNSANYLQICFYLLKVTNANWHF